MSFDLILIAAQATANKACDYKKFNVQSGNKRLTSASDWNSKAY